MAHGGLALWSGSLPPAAGCPATNFAQTRERSGPGVGIGPSALANRPGVEWGQTPRRADGATGADVAASTPAGPSSPGERARLPRISRVTSVHCRSRSFGSLFRVAPRAAVDSRPHSDQHPRPLALALDTCTQHPHPCSGHTDQSRPDRPARPPCLGTGPEAGQWRSPAVRAEPAAPAGSRRSDRQDPSGRSRVSGVPGVDSCGSPAGGGAAFVGSWLRHHRSRDLCSASHCRVARW